MVRPLGLAVSKKLKRAKGIVFEKKGNERHPLLVKLLVKIALVLPKKKPLPAIIKKN